MPWSETSVMNERIRFIGDWLSGLHSKTALCRRYGISRPTGDKWIARYEQEGPSGLHDRSRRPRHCPNQTAPEICNESIKMKHAHPTWGPCKLLDLLRRRVPEKKWPADSTGGEILKRAGLVKARRPRRRVASYPDRFAPADQANASWSADFKGDFKTGNGRRCYPLTISDNYSRYLLQCRALERTGCIRVRPWFEQTFREFGLPAVIRTDNGPPFASTAIAGLSPLARWWIKLGIRPERIEPGKPQQNGRHERMHRTLKADTANPPGYSCSAQQARFDRFMEEYNHDRSHEALRRQTPGSAYERSTRSYPAVLPPVEYDEHITVRSVRHNGQIKWQGRMLYVSEVLRKERVGLQQIDNDRWELRFSFFLLGHISRDADKLIPPSAWHQNKPENV